MSSTVLSELNGPVRKITLNRSDKLNAINHDLVRDTLAAFREANADVATKVVIFSGAGRAFCAGDDLGAHDDEPDPLALRALIDDLQAITREIVLGNKPVVGAIHGWAVGAGFEWAINCDLAIWSTGAKAFFPELQWGMFVTGGVTSLLPSLVGLAKAKELVYLAERHTAADLHAMGLAWRVVEEDEVMPQAEAVANRIAEHPMHSIIDFKRTINRAFQLDVEAALAMETEAALRGATHPEAIERVKAFGS